MITIRELTYASIALRIFLSVLLGGVLGWERGRKNRPAGLRTYMLVCLGSTVVMITNQYVAQVFNTGDPVRLGAQVISGIGFLGAGSIIVTGHNQVRGITTAAGLWAAACVGLAIGIGFYEVAIIGGVLVFLILTFMTNIDLVLRKRAKVLDVYIELTEQTLMSTFIQYIHSVGLEIVNIQLENEHHLTPEALSFIITLRGQAKQGRVDILQVVRQAPNIAYIEEL